MSPIWPWWLPRRQCGTGRGRAPAKKRGRDRTIGKPGRLKTERRAREGLGEDGLARTSDLHVHLLLSDAAAYPITRHILCASSITLQASERIQSPQENKSQCTEYRVLRKKERRQWAGGGACEEANFADACQINCPIAPTRKEVYL